MGARDKINTILLNVNINKQKSVHICGYKLPINVLNSVQKDLALAKISLKVVGGLHFLTQPVRFSTWALDCYIYQYHVCLSANLEQSATWPANT